MIAKRLIMSEAVVSYRLYSIPDSGLSTVEQYE